MKKQFYFICAFCVLFVGALLVKSQNAAYPNGDFVLPTTGTFYGNGAGISNLTASVGILWGTNSADGTITNRGVGVSINTTEALYWGGTSGAYLTNLQTGTIQSSGPFKSPGAISALDFQLIGANPAIWGVSGGNVDFSGATAGVWNFSQSPGDITAHISAGDFTAKNNPGFYGGGGSLTNLNASNISSGTIADARLSANVALLNAQNNFSQSNNFSANVTSSGTVAAGKFVSTATGGTNQFGFTQLTNIENTVSVSTLGVDSTGLITTNVAASTAVPVTNYAYRIFPDGANSSSLAASSTFSTVANTVFVQRMRVDLAMNFTNVLFRQTATNGATCHYGFSVYSSDGATRLLDTGPLPGLGSNPYVSAPLTTTGTLQPGIYWCAWTTDNTALGLECISVSGPISTLLNSAGLNSGTTTPFTGTAANASAAGQNPTTLGTITGSALTQVPVLIWE